MIIVKQSFGLFKPEPAKDMYERIGAATCFDQWGPPEGLEGLEQYIRGLIRDGEAESVFEHGAVSAVIVADHGVAAALSGHRHAVLTIRSNSRLLSDEPNSYKVVSPVRFNEELRPARLNGREIWRSTVEFSEKGWPTLIDGLEPEPAWSVLPQCVATRIFMTCCIRGWRQIMRSWTAPRAHPQMRELMGLGLAELKTLYPVLFEDIG